MGIFEESFYLMIFVSYDLLNYQIILCIWCMLCHLLYLRKQSLGNISEWPCPSICLSVRLCNQVLSKSFSWRNIGRSYFTQRFLITWGCVMILTHHLGKFKVTGTKSLEQICIWSTINLSYGESLTVFTLHNDCLWPWGVSWFWLKVIWVSLRSPHLKEFHNLCLVYTFLMVKHWVFLLHIKIAYDLRVSLTVTNSVCY